VKVIDVEAAETCLARLVQEALDGEEIVIARGNDRLVRLVPVAAMRPERSLGWARGQVTIAPDFDAPLDDF
jgi:antitoxin (DNA-binding transcriptional repressor) of toxin-antitoxin stability system